MSIARSAQDKIINAASRIGRRHKAALAKMPQLLDLSIAIWALYDEFCFEGNSFIFFSSCMRVCRDSRGEPFTLRHDAAGFRCHETPGHRRRDS